MGLEGKNTKRKQNLHQTETNRDIKTEDAHDRDRWEINLGQREIGYVVGKINQIPYIEACFFQIHYDRLLSSHLHLGFSIDLFSVVLPIKILKALFWLCDLLILI